MAVLPRARIVFVPDVTVKREAELESSLGGAFKLLRHGLGLSAFA